MTNGERASAEPPDATRAMDALRRIVRALRQSSARAEREHGVTTAQLFALRRIGAQPGISLTQLALATRTAESSVSEVVARLRERGFVSRKRGANDARRAAFALTVRGAAVVARAAQTPQEQLVSGFTAMPVEDRGALTRTLEGWVRAAGLDALAPTMFFEPDRKSGRTRGAKT